VVIFGQNPYPRLESATGIAMFDNAFADWEDGRFGRVTSMRCIIKAACIHRHGVARDVSVTELRALLARHQVVTPPEWFQAMLAQGVLLLNAALTASSDGSVSTARHTAFWKPVVETVVERILEARGGQGVVFAWWGNHAKSLRALVERLQERHPGVPVRHVDHCNPAAMGDAFCEGDPFGAIDEALASLGLPPVDWLPRRGWAQAHDREEADRMGGFIEHTRELHRLYLERLQGAGEEALTELEAIRGVFELPLPTLAEAMAPLLKLFPSLGGQLRAAQEFARRTRAAPLGEHEIGALHLYTMESLLYRQLNATLRDPDRTRATPWLPYLRLFLSATARLRGAGSVPASLWRGVARDLRREYPVGRTVTWWGVSSCTAKPAVARSFLGGRGRRMLFEVVPCSAVSIRSCSAFTGEDEYVLVPGARLQVVEVTEAADGLCHVRLAEAESNVWKALPEPVIEPAAPVLTPGPALLPEPAPAGPGVRLALAAAALALLAAALAWWLG
jgi:uracil DNA glycosylase